MATEPKKTDVTAIENDVPMAPEGQPSTDLPSPVNTSEDLLKNQENDQNSKVSWTKICLKCSVQGDTAGDFCPNCGASYVRGRKLPKITRKTAVIVLSLLVVGGTAAGVTMAVQHSQEIAAEEAAAKEAKATADAAAKEKARELEAVAAKENAQRAVRAIIVTGLEESVQKDAVARVDEGRLDGPIERTECTPLGGGSVDDLTAITGTFECIAVNEKREDGSESGYVFSATVNWDAASYSWHLGR